MDEDYMSVTYELKDSEAIDKMVQEMDRIDEALDEEELKVRESLSRTIGDYEKPLLDNCERIGILDFTYAKAVLAIRRNLVKPEIINDHLLEIEDGRHIEVESLLEKKGQIYRPVSLYLKQGVTCITGANMGGKTVSLKLAGLVALMAQYGFFVPAKSVRVGLSQHIQMLIGDTQSLERGLSSFGGEMEELREALDLSKPRTLLLIDELASGTNPKEGTALSKALVVYLMKKQYISLFTTHFDSVTEIPGVVNLQVTGLANADFDKLKRELKYANRKERIRLVAKYMDYRLMVVEGQRDVPKEAIHIAEILGLYDEIISTAKEYL
jgi:DNA mismatch repair ATPase MutS